MKQKQLFMLFDCIRIKELWKCVSNVINMDISWKRIVCGFPGYSLCERISSINHVIGFISYCIFKINSRCKFDNLDFKYCNIKGYIKKELFFYNELSKVHGNDLFVHNYYDRLINVLR